MPESTLIIEVTVLGPPLFDMTISLDHTRLKYDIV